MIKDDNSRLPYLQFLGFKAMNIATLASSPRNNGAESSQKPTTAESQPQTTVWGQSSYPTEKTVLTPCLPRKAKAARHGKLHQTARQVYVLKVPEEDPNVAPNLASKQRVLLLSFDGSANPKIFRKWYYLIISVVVIIIFDS